MNVISSGLGNARNIQIPPGTLPVKQIPQMMKFLSFCSEGNEESEKVFVCFVFLRKKATKYFAERSARLSAESQYKHMNRA